MEYVCATLSSVGYPAVQYFSTLSHKWHNLEKRLLNMKYVFLCFKLLPCCSDDSNSSGYFPGVSLLLKADVSEPCIGSIFNR